MDGKETKNGHRTPTSYSSFGAGDLKEFRDDREYVLEILQTNDNTGLSSEEARRRLERYGSNEMDKGQGISLLSIFIRQTVNSMVIVLIAAAAISLAIRDWISGGVIVGVIVINVGVGFFQQLKAEKTIADLRTLQTSSAIVLRNDEEIEISAVEIVPGDIVKIRSGDSVPADCRILSTSANFETDEAILTGESLPVQKDADISCDSECPIGDRVNMIFSSTVVTCGRCVAVVVATGMQTELGKIAKALSDRGPDDEARNSAGSTTKNFVFEGWRFFKFITGLNGATPLHRRMAALSLWLFGVAVLLAIISLATQKFDVNREIAIYAIVVAIAMIPASLVVVLTITMAIGAKVMASRNVVVRNLHSLEALGSVNYICSDKTGTLTQGKMEVKKAWSYESSEAFIVQDGVGIDPTTGVVIDENTKENISDGDIVPGHVLWSLAATASLANSAKLRQDEHGEWKADGDPTETALRVFVKRAKVNLEKFRHVTEFPFDSSIKRMTTICQDQSTNEMWAFTKGAVERIISLCPGADENKIIHEMELLASEGLRVLAFAKRRLDGEKEDLNDRSDVERNLTFLGLAGIYDPPRQESADAVERCHEAGISVHMLTGDHAETAKSIAKKIGILKHEKPGSVMTAVEFDALSIAEIDALEELPFVIARCSPTTKVNMIDALHRRNMVVAMTGDGVNDCPSLKRADIGIAMGVNGSDVAKDASDIVLSDDNFASITAGIEEGRRMTCNIQKFTLHLLAGNVAQALFLVVGLAFQDREGYSVFPLSPVEVLWIIMITSSLPAMGLGQQAADADVMKRPPPGVNSKSTLFSLEVITDICVYGLILTVLCLVTFIGIVYGPSNPNGSNWNLGIECNQNYTSSCNKVFQARSTGFVMMTWCLLFLAWEVVDMRRSLFKLDERHTTRFESSQSALKWHLRQSFNAIYNNKLLFWSVILGIVTVFPVVYIPVINTYVFQHGSISWHWAVCVGGTVVFIVCIEIYKWGKRQFYRRRSRTYDGHTV